MKSDPGFQRIQEMWESASAALVGIGAPPRIRNAITTGVPLEDPSLRTAAGDVSLHFFDHDGAILDYPGTERMVRIPLETLHRIPNRIAVAAGVDKTPSIIAAAKQSLFHYLITDEPTARALVTALGLTDDQSPHHSLPDVAAAQTGA